MQEGQEDASTLPGAQSGELFYPADTGYRCSTGTDNKQGRGTALLTSLGLY